MAAPYTPTTFQRAGRSVVSTSWGEHWNLVFNGWTVVGEAPSVMSPYEYVTRDELGDFETDPDITEFRDRLMAYVSQLVDDFISAHPGGGGGGAGSAAELSFSPTGTISSTNAQAAIAEVAIDASTELAAHAVATAAHAANRISLTGVAGATDVQGGFAALASQVSAATDAAAGKLDRTGTFTEPPSATLFRRDLNFAVATNQKNLTEWAIQGVVRAYQNEWGAWRFRAGVYPSFSDSGVRFIVEPGDYTGTGGTGGNAIEIVNRNLPEGVGRQVWGRRWLTGQLIRNGSLFGDLYIHTGGPGAPLPANLPSGIVIATTATPVPVV